MSENIVQSGNWIFLNSNGRWYKYDTTRTPIGSGAMGVIYLGIDCKSNEYVAIKRILDKYSSVASIRDRAKLESSLMFRHRNLVVMLGCCELAEHYGPFYIISKFVNGENIDSFINKNLRKCSDASYRICQLFLPVLDALDYLHGRNILHLDVKPSNIMVENGNNVRLMDLGIVQCDDSLAEKSSGTMGTPKYAAPEQISMQANGLDSLTCQTDIYEAGVTLYELLTGKNPYCGTSMKEIKDKHNRVILPPDPNLSPGLLQVLRKATRINYSDRYHSVKEFKRELEDVLYAPPKNKVSGIYIIFFSLLLIAIVLLIILWIL